MTESRGAGLPIIVAPPERQDEVADLIATVVRGEIVEQYETELTKSGKGISVSPRMSPIRDRGRLTGVSAISRTERAMQNILGASAAEKDRLEISQRAMLNILDDFDSEAIQRVRAEAEVRRINATLEERVRDRTAQLEAANEELEEFSYSVAHDLRTPLRAIDGFSRILLEDYADKLDAEGQRVLNVVRDSTVKMARLIDDILGFTRLGRSEMRPALLNMGALVRASLADELAAALVGREVAIDIGNLPDARGDRAMLQRVWTNLLENAIKFTASTPAARIEIRATTRTGETIYSVRDNGAGFDMRYAPKLFGVCQRLHGTEFPGTGIGLAIVRRIITRHGGRVWAEGKTGGGATFYFALPTEEKIDA